MKSREHKSVRDDDKFKWRNYLIFRTTAMQTDDIHENLKARITRIIFNLSNKLYEQNSCHYTLRDYDH